MVLKPVGSGGKLPFPQLVSLPDFSHQSVVSYSSWWFFAHPFEKYAQVKMGIISPGIGVKNKKYLKPPTSVHIVVFFLTWRLANQCGTVLRRIQKVLKKPNFCGQVARSALVVRDVPVILVHFFIKEHSQFWAAI